MHTHTCIANTHIHTLNIHTMPANVYTDSLMTDIIVEIYAHNTVIIHLYTHD